MKKEIYSLRADNKELIDTKYESTQNNKNIDANIVTEKKESETQTEPILRREDSKGDASYRILKLRQCRSFYKGKGCKRRDSCWFSHSEGVCHYWLEESFRCPKDLCR